MTSGSSGKPAPARGHGGKPRPKPVSVRGESPEPSAPPPDSTTVFEVDDEAWVARVVGRSVTGGSSDSGAPLLLLVFRKEADSGVPAKEAWAVGEGLETISRDRLVEIWRSARPYRAKWEPGPVFKEVRRDQRSR